MGLADTFIKQTEFCNSGYGSGSGYGDGYGSGSGYGYGSGSGYGSGDGDGSGYGYGDGDGSGYGYGYGDGSSYGSGDGSGYGYGDGSSYGSGDGSGYGYGSSYGYGYGNGYGSGDGSKDYLEYVLEHAAGERGKQVKAEGAVLAFWKSNSDGTPSNGGDKYKEQPVKRIPGMVEEIDGPLEICTKNALHATFHPPAHKGKKLWVAAMYPPFQTSEDKLGSLKREIICEIPDFFSGK